MSVMHDLLHQALQLPQPERAELAHELLLSLESGPPDPGSEAAWRAELEARLARVESGQFAARDWREALADIRRPHPTPHRLQYKE